MWSLSFLFLLSCLPTRMDIKSSGTTNPNTFVTLLSVTIFYHSNWKVIHCEHMKTWVWVFWPIENLTMVCAPSKTGGRGDGRLPRSSWATWQSSKSKRDCLTKGKKASEVVFWHTYASECPQLYLPHTKQVPGQGRCRAGLQTGTKAWDIQTRGELGKRRTALLLRPGVRNASHALALSRALMVGSREGEHPMLSLQL